ncbi:MAG: type II toxin-antitoxin system HicB family antitoxin [Chloroflexi bacterium]|nr:type II toxin-antitoxin system HicB family antitoxin [Chloroflexota bacterium]MBI3731897.1 type II toxin-antitoxin system HicB family antitoxin [Chloroflexota bacterium]
MNQHRYEIIIWWSREDEAFVAQAPELPGCMAHGQTHAEALASIHTAIELWLDTARELNRPIPEPQGRLVLA